VKFFLSSSHHLNNLVLQNSAKSKSFDKKISSVGIFPFSFLASNNNLPLLWKKMAQIF